MALHAAPAKERNVIVRPHGPGVTFIQLDDLAVDNLARLAPARNSRFCTNIMAPLAS